MALRFDDTVWRSSEQSHGPFVLAVVLYIFWSLRTELLQARTPRLAVPGWAMLIAGLLLYMLGVWTKVAVIEGASNLPIVAGGLWIMGGPALVRRMWFPLMYLLLAIPIPSYLLGSSTAVLKQFVSQAAEGLLYALGYPVARTGVVLTVGQYQLLVADACSGMNSILSLTAVGLLFTFIARPAQRWHATLLVAAILPIAVLANIIRVTILCLITYHLGDEAGQGFLHESAGILMFVVAVFSLIFIDWLCRRYAPALPKDLKNG